MPDKVMKGAKKKPAAKAKTAIRKPSKKKTTEPPLVQQGTDHPFGLKDLPGMHHVEEEQAENPNSWPVFHTVLVGESEEDIAKIHGVTVAQILQWNGRKSSLEIQTGDTLRIYISKKMKKIFHQVQPGEYDQSIATMYGVSVKELVDWNHGDAGVTSIPGRIITLYTDKPWEELNELRGQIYTVVQSEKIEHTIQQNERPEDVANKYGVTVFELMQWNGGLLSFEVGKKLVIHPDWDYLKKHEKKTNPTESSEESLSPARRLQFEQLAKAAQDHVKDREAFEDLVGGLQDTNKSLEAHNVVLAQSNMELRDQLKGLEENRQIWIRALNNLRSELHGSVLNNATLRKENERLQQVRHEDDERDRKERSDLIANANRHMEEKSRLAKDCEELRNKLTNALLDNMVVRQANLDLRNELASKNVGMPKKVYHTVQPGQSIGSIAVKYHVSKEEIRKWNNIDPLTGLDTGDNLVIWMVEKVQPEAKVKPIFLRVQEGEDLPKLAWRCGVTVQEMKDWNRLQPKSFENVFSKDELIVIYPTGTKVIRNYFHVVQRGETFESLAASYDVEVNEIRTWNRINDSVRDLLSGQEVVICTVVPPKSNEEALRKEVGELRTAHRVMVDQRDSLASQLREKERNLDKTLLDKMAVREENRKYQVRLQEVIDQRDNLARELNKRMHLLDDANREKDRLGNANNLLRDEITQLKNQVASFRKANENLTEANVSLRVKKAPLRSQTSIPRKVYHEVQAGENPLDVAKKYKVAVAELANWNQCTGLIGLLTLFVPGNRLILWLYDEQGESGNHDNETAYLRSEIKRLESSNGRLARDLQTEIDYRNRLKEETLKVDQKQHDVHERLRHDAEEHQAINKDLQKENLRLCRAYGTLRQEYDTLFQDVKHLGLMNKEKTADNQKYWTNNTTLQKENDRLRKLCDEKMDENQRHWVANADLRRENDELRSRHGVVTHTRNLEIKMKLELYKKYEALFNEVVQLRRQVKQMPIVQSPVEAKAINLLKELLRDMKDGHAPSLFNRGDWFEVFSDLMDEVVKEDQDTTKPVEQPNKYMTGCVDSADCDACGEHDFCKHQAELQAEVEKKELAAAAKRVSDLANSMKSEAEQDDKENKGFVDGVDSLLDYMFGVRHSERKINTEDDLIHISELRKNRAEELKEQSEKLQERSEDDLGSEDSLDVIDEFLAGFSAKGRKPIIGGMCHAGIPNPFLCATCKVEICEKHPKQLKKKKGVFKPHHVIHHHHRSPFGIPVEGITKEACNRCPLRETCSDRVK